jgi:transcriptional regulator with XRE-family HTH domain
VTLANRLMEICDVLDITRKEFARITGVCPSLIYEYVDGVKMPNRESMRRIATACGVGPEELMGAEPLRVNFLEVKIDGRTMYFPTIRDAVKHIVGAWGESIELKYVNRVIP